MNVDKDKIWKGIQDDSRMREYNRGNNRTKTIVGLISIMLLVLSFTYTATRYTSENRGDYVANTEIENVDSDEFRQIEVAEKENIENHVTESFVTDADVVSSGRREADNANSNFLSNAEMGKNLQPALDTDELELSKGAKSGKVKKENSNIEKTVLAYDQEVFENNLGNQGSSSEDQQIDSEQVTFGTPPSTAIKDQAQGEVQVEQVQKSSQSNQADHKSETQSDQESTARKSKVESIVPADQSEKSTYAESGKADSSQIIHSLLVQQNLSALPFQGANTTSMRLDKAVGFIKKQPTIQSSFFLQGGAGAVQTKIIDIAKEEQTYSLKDFYDHEISTQARLGMEFMYRKLSIRVEGIYENHRFRGTSIQRDTMYRRNLDNSLTKLENITSNTLYQRYSNLGLGLSVAYSIPYRGWNFSPYVGGHYIVWDSNNVSLLSSGDPDAGVLNTNPATTDKLRYYAGIRMGRKIVRNTRLYADLSTSFSNDLGDEQVYSVRVVPVFLSIGVSRAFVAK